MAKLRRRRSSKVVVRMTMGKALRGDCSQHIHDLLGKLELALAGSSDSARAMRSLNPHAFVESHMFDDNARDRLWMDTCIVTNGGHGTMIASTHRLGSPSDASAGILRTW